MKKPEYIYDIDTPLPWAQGALYALQWAVIMFPVLIIVSNLAGKALNLDGPRTIRFLQLTVLTSGLFTTVQGLWGHRYPLLDGPAMALLLTFLVLAPLGIESIQGGTILGGSLLIILVLSGVLKNVVSFATPNVVGVILMLISFSLLPYLTRSMTGATALNPQGDLTAFLTSLGLVVVMAVLSHRLRGFFKTIALLMGMLLGSLVFALLTPLHWNLLMEAPWVALPLQWTPGAPRLYWPAVLAFAASYVAVLVNSLGSYNGIAAITDFRRLPRSIAGGVLLNGMGGLVTGFLGIVGTVSYSLSPGVVLANRVASRFATVYCGALLLVAAFMPKLAALLAVVPAPVVGAALCTSMGAQVGAGFAVVATNGLSSRDYFVVGVPIIVGTLIAFLPEAFLHALPPGARVFLGNGLIVGIALVVLLEHVLMKKVG